MFADFNSFFIREEDGKYICKFGQRPKNTLLKVFYLRYSLAMIALNSTEEEVSRFFKKNLIVKEPFKSNISNLVVEINDVKNTLKVN